MPRRVRETEGAFGDSREATKIETAEAKWRLNAHVAEGGNIAYIPLPLLRGELSKLATVRVAEAAADH